MSGTIDPDRLYPIAGVANTVQLKPLLLQRPGAFTVGNVSVGEFSYYSDFNDPLGFFERNLRYNFGFSGARFEMGRYCAVAHGATFIMADANHAMVGPSTFPFPIFGGEWAERLPLCEMPFPNKGDIRIGHDVWFGYECAIMPGVQIGSGAVIGARAVVTRDVPPYAIVAGNPARIVRYRFEPDVIDRLLRLNWWDWPTDKVTAALPLLVKGCVADLEAFT